jgi:hypothetical protein
MNGSDTLYLRLKESWEQAPEQFDDPMLARAFAEQGVNTDTRIYQDALRRLEANARSVQESAARREAILTTELAETKAALAALERTMIRETKARDAEISLLRREQEPALVKITSDESGALAAFGWEKNAAG